MVSTEMVCNPDQFRRMDVSIVFYSSGTALLVPWPEEQSRLLAPIRPFDSTVLYIYIYLNTDHIFVYHRL